MKQKVADPSKFRRLAVIAPAMLLLLFLVGLSPVGRAPAVQAMPDDAAPFTVIPKGVADYTLAPPVVFWRESPNCNSGPPTFESVNMLVLYGGKPRAVYSQFQGCGTSAILSNIVADADYLYWIAPAGLVRQPRDANSSSSPQLVNALIAGPGELADGGDVIYTLSRTGGNTEINYVRKDNNARVPVTTLSGQAFVLSFDGEYVYYLVGSTLIRLKPGDSPRELASGVTGYYADGRRSGCDQSNNCFLTHLVFIGRNNKVVRFDNLDDTTRLTYTSPDNSAVVLGITSDGKKLYLYERRTTVCDPLCSYSHNLIRAARNGIPTAEDGPIYSTGDLIGHPAVHDEFLYWREHTTPTDGALKRLSTKTGPLSLNLNVNGILITQGIQHLSNNVPLIENRHTFVRVFVQSNGADAPGVTAFLYGSWSGVSQAGPLLPVNPAGTKLTVRSSYLQEDINQAFLFELPWDWTTKDDLRLRVELNPYRLPLETNYADNSFNSGPFDFKPSGRLAVQFVSFGFSLNNQTYYPSLINDVFAAYSWIRRTYPLTSAPGFMNDPSPGFRPNNWLVFDAGLGARVNRSSPECNQPPYLIKDQNGVVIKDERRSCASAYTNARMSELRLENNLPKDLFMYGLIRDLGGDFFPRGQAGNDRVSSGPAAPVWTDFILYAEHEIGHTLGRGHPLTGNGQCDLEGGDPSPSYPNAWIGPLSGVVEGFDVGDPAFGIPRQVLPGPSRVDMMAYCGPQWISDQNYKNLFAAIPSASAGFEAPAAAGDVTLSVSGVIDPSTDTAAFVLARTGDAPIRPATPGSYKLRLVGVNGATLAEYPLPVQEIEHGPGWLGFDHVVRFPEETRRLEVVKTAGNEVLAKRPVSAAAPTIRDVRVSATVTPTLTLSWNAGDPDGDALHFDVHYSRDGGRTFRPLLLDLRQEQATIDTSHLGGGDQSVFRVVADDGVRAARADSSPVALPIRPPQVRILAPGHGAMLRYGQTLNLVGEAYDLQDGGLSGASLLWTANGEPLGEGALLTLPDLPPGDHRIELTATNSAGLSAVAGVSLTVIDDLTLPGPILSAAPASVAWHIEAGDRDIQQAQITLSNVGGGDLTWQAKSDANWLSLTPTGGKSGSKLTLQANPVGLDANRLYTATVTLTAAGANGAALSPVTLPVQLAVGNLREGPVAAGGAKSVYLPFVRR